VTLPVFKVLIASAPGDLKAVGAGSNGSLVLFDGSAIASYSKAGVLRWRKDVPTRLLSPWGLGPGILIGSTGTVFSATPQNVCALNKDTGAWEWPQSVWTGDPGCIVPTTSLNYEISRTLMDRADNIYITTEVQITSISSSGAIRWATGVRNRGYIHPFLGRNEDLLYLTHGPYVPYNPFITAAYDTHSGAIVHEAGAWGMVALMATPWPALYGSYLDWGVDAPIECSLDLTLCVPFTVPSGVPWNSGPSTGNVATYVNPDIIIAYRADARTLSAIARTGAVLWTRVEPLVTMDIPAAMPPIPRLLSDSKGTIYAATLDKQLVAINGRTGNELWRRQFDVEIASLLLGDDGSLYVTAGALYTSGPNANAPVTPPPPSSFGPPGIAKPFGSIAEPVNTATGNYYTSHTDLAVPGKGLSFSFTRFYNSADTYNGPLGFGWTHSFNVLLTVNGGGSVTVKEGDGGAIAFTPTGGGNYSPSTPGVFDVLKQNGGGTFTLTRKNQTKLNFSAAGKLTSIVDRNGNTQTLTYNGGGRLASIADSSGRSYTFSYDGSGRITSLTDPIARVLQYTYDTAGNLATFRDALGGVTTYAYDGSHWMTSATDPRGNVYLQNIYDAQGRVTEQKNAKGFVTTFAYHTPATGTTTITDPLGNATRHVHDSSLRLVQVIDAAGGVTAYAYGANNLKSSTTDALGRTQSFTHDVLGNLLSVTDPVAKITSFSYDAKSNLTKITDRLGRITQFTYSASGNLTQISDAAGGVSIFTYDGAGQTLSAKNARNFTTSFQYDAAGNLIKLTDALAGTVQMTYDGVGRLLTVKNQLGKTGSRTYDANNRLLTVTDPLASVTAFQYDGNGNLTRITDANGRATQYAYDSTNKLTQVTDAIGGLTQYAYNANTDLVSVTDAKNHVTTYGYDSLRRLKTTTDPLGKQRQYSYDQMGNVVSTLDGNNRTNFFAYNALNRLVSMALSDGKNVAYTYDAVGNRLTMTDWRGTSNYAYDVLNRVLSMTTPDAKTVAYQYDPIGNRARLTYPDGKQVQYSYDALNRLMSATDWASKTTTYTYDVAGNLTRIAHPNGAASSHGYDGANRLVGIVNKSGAQTLSSFGYTLDNVGNRLQVTSSAGGVTQFGYDGLYRLTSWRPPSGQVTQYVYDAVGNRTSIIGSAGTINYAYNAADELTAAGASTFTYDGNGNLLLKTTGGNTITHTWDALNRLLGLVGPGVNAQYAYDGDGNRVSQTVPGGTYQYVNDTATPLPVVLDETGPDGPISYAYGSSMVSARGNGFEHWYQFEGLGSVATVTSQTAALRANYLYDPWGRVLNPVDPLGGRNKYKFTSESADSQTGLLYLRARYYDAVTGRFLSRDPFGGFLYAPVTEHRYQYALNNPIRYVDPSGLTAAEPSSSQGSVLAAFIGQQLPSSTQQLPPQCLYIPPGTTIMRAATPEDEAWHEASQMLFEIGLMCAFGEQGCHADQFRRAYEASLRRITGRGYEPPQTAGETIDLLTRIINSLEGLTRILSKTP
jgi:RHS repeat-associated protein